MWSDAQRETGRETVSGLLWPHISSLQMNINKELLISAACAVCEYVCMQGRHGGAVWTSLPPPLCFSSFSSSSTQPASLFFSLSSFLLLTLALTFLFFITSLRFSGLLLLLLFPISLARFTPAFILPVYRGSLCFEEGRWCRRWRRFCHKSVQTWHNFCYLSAIWCICAIRII